MTFVFDPFAPSTIEDPYPWYARLRRDFPLYRNPDRAFWAVSRAEDVQRVGADWQTFSNAEGMDLDRTGQLIGAGNFLDMDPPRHDDLRKLVRGAFTRASVLRWREAVAADADMLLDALIEAGGGDAVAALTAPLPVMTIARLIGVPRESVPRLLETVHAISDRPGGSAEIPREAVEASQELREFFTCLSTCRRRDPKPDLISMLAHAEEKGEISSAEVVGLCLILFGAGSETVSSFLSNALLLLAEHPDQRAALTRDPSLLPRAVEEILRYDAPVQNVVRTTTHSIAVNGTTLPRGSRVVLLYGSANRDERAFVDPARLDIQRDRGRHLAFGHGIHFCLGAHLARLQGDVVLRRVLSRIPDYEVCDPIRRMMKVNSRGLECLTLQVR